MAFCIKDITASLPWVIIICLTGISAQDCNNYNSLPNLHDRDPTIQYSPTNPAICDDSLPEGWYRASVYDMATSPVPQNRCGTVEGFYMDIAVPTDLAEHDARACLSDGVDHCFYYVNIKVKNCGDYRIYYLPSSGFCSSAYCFHLKDETLVPSYILPTPSVNFNHLEWKESGSDKIPQLVFRCDFQPSATESDLLYFVSWSVNKTDVGSDKIVTTSTLSNGHLYEEDITNAGFRHGIWLFCSVRTQYSISSPSTGRAMSSGFFAGFEIKRNTGTMFDTLYISEKDNAALRLSPTVPFGCENLNANCKLLIHIEDPDIGECEGSTFITESSRCQMEITGKTEADQGTYYTNGEYKTDYSMTLWHAQSEDSYDKKSHYTVALKTNTVKHLFWSNTSLRSIPVNIRYENSIWRGHQSERKFCAATGDPHFQTFDGIEYTFMGEGSYVLYENMNSSKTVHIKTSLCRPNHQATCTCGVAVRAGRDIFVMDTCSNSTIIDFPVCDDGVLDVRSDGDKKWKVTFPTGTIVRIDMYPWGRPWGGYLLNVFIYPSAADENNTRGLCGYMDGRKDLQFDYLKSDGTYSLDYEDFAQSWQLTEDYFFDHTNLDKFDKVGHWSNMTQLCVCPRATKNGKSPRGRFLEAEAEVHCSYKQFVGKCQTDRFKNFQCFVKTGGLKRRKRRAIHAHSYSNSVRNKRTVSYVVSEAEAQQQCEDTFNASSSYKGCSENGVSSVFMVSCINDYKILGEQSVFNVSLNAFLDTCVSIIGKDVELKSNNPSLVGELFNNSCQNNCTGHGYCDKGYCACDTGYAGSDCSFDIENPPTISSLKVFCDTLDGACDTISIYGRNFLNTNTFKCKVSRIQILQDGSSVYVGSSIENGTQRSPFEAMCTLPMSDSSIPNVFVNAYNLSVSNDGNSFSDISLVFVYDSLCQEVIESNGTTSFVFRNGYCFIDGSCIPDGQRNQKDICQQCLVTNDTYGWIQINDCTTSSATMSTITDKPSTSSASTSTSTTSANHIDPASSKPSTDIESSNTIVIVVAMCLVIGVIIALIVTIAVVKHYNFKQRESRPSNKLGSQIDIEFTTGRGPAKPVFQTDLNGLFCVEQDKHFDFSRPGSRASLHDSNDNTHVNFSTMINQ